VSKPTSNKADTKAIQQVAQQQLATGQQQNQEGNTLFNLGLPGLESAQSYYQKLASGDPNALARANAPAVQAITQQTDAAKKNIQQDSPRGGQTNLALQEADINKGAQISNLTTQSYNNAFGSEASLGGQNVSQGNAATNTGINATNSAASQYSNLLNINAEQKAANMGFFGSLFGDAATLGSAYIGRPQS